MGSVGSGAARDAEQRQARRPPVSGPSSIRLRKPTLARPKGTLQGPALVAPRAVLTSSRVARAQMAGPRSAERFRGGRSSLSPSLALRLAPRVRVGRARDPPHRRRDDVGDLGHRGPALGRSRLLPLAPGSGSSSTRRSTPISSARLRALRVPHRGEGRAGSRGRAAGSRGGPDRRDGARPASGARRRRHRRLLSRARLVHRALLGGDPVPDPVLVGLRARDRRRPRRARRERPRWPASSGASPS